MSNSLFREAGSGKKLLIWGTGRCYDRYVNALKYAELSGDVSVKAVTDFKALYEKVDGWPFVPMLDIDYKSFDVLVIAEERQDKVYQEIKDIAKKSGMKNENIIPMKVFTIPGFSIDKYLQVKNSEGGGYIYICLQLLGRHDIPFSRTAVYNTCCQYF